VQIYLSERGLAGYKSNAQRARVATEAWAQGNLYCPNCESPHLDRSRANTPAVDFDCPICHAPFQLKAQSHTFSARIVDAAHSTMIRAIRENKTPNLLALHYEPSAWAVSNLILIPSFAFPLSAIEKRKPLSATARRAGWVGCNILLGAIPLDAKIPLIVDGVTLPQKKVREQYARIRPLEKLESEQRGWTLDVLNAVRSLGKTEFALNDVYALESRLARLHPANQHVRDKIRQQLQVLRDLGLLEFLGRGEYRLC
jgi:type II restriction enzyme